MIGRRRRRRHQRCLENIARLERELFPEWFASSPLNPANPFDIRPGARWLVDDASNFTQIMTAGGLIKSGLAMQHKLAWERAVLFGEEPPREY